MSYAPSNVATHDGQPVVYGGQYVTWGPPAYPPVFDTFESTPPTRYVWAVGPGASSATPRPVRELTGAYGRVLTRRVAGHAYATFTIDGRSDEALDIVDLVSDLWITAIYPDNSTELLFRGRCVTSNHFIDADRHVRQVQAVDYRGMLTLAARVEPPVPAFSGVDQAQIVWQLIQHRQGQDGGDWGITEGVGDTSGQNRDLNTLLPGKPIGEAIDELLNREGGGEWTINPDLEVDRWFPRRGAANGVVLDYGGIVAGLQVGTATFANSAVATGNPDTTPVVAATDDVATDERGRWTASQAFPSVSLQDTVNAKAVWLRDEASTVRRQWTAYLAPHWWRGDAHVGLGDVCRMIVDDGSLVFDGDVRVVEIMQVQDETEQVTFGLVEEPEAVSS